MNDQLSPKVVLGIAAHPDDLDFYAGGTMATFAKQGATVYYLVLTDGGKGSADRNATPESVQATRQQEQQKAAKALGVQEVFFCSYPDGALENTLAVKRDVVKTIRQVRPDVVISLDPSVLYSTTQGFINHADHRAAGQAALDAVYPLARDHMSFPDLLEAGYEPHKVDTVLLTRFNEPGTTFAVNITDTIEAKLEAVSAHLSQSTVQEMKATIRDLAVASGQPYGYQYAEAFVRIDIR